MCGHASKKKVASLSSDLLSLAVKAVRKYVAMLLAPKLIQCFFFKATQQQTTLL